MEPRLLRAFVAVAEELHFGRAARRLHVSQPPLSMQIKKLESELGTLLFARTQRSVQLTEAGQVLLGRARHLLAEAERARLDVRRVALGETGVLSVGYTPTATYSVLPPIVRVFRAKRPDVRLELLELRSPDQPAALREGRIEIGFVCGPVDVVGLGEHVLERESLVAVVPARHALAREDAIPIAALAREPFVMVRPEVEPAWADASARALRKAGVTIDVAQHTDTKLALLGLVAAGVGVSVVSASMQHVRRDGVVFRPLVGLRVRLPLMMLTAEAPSARAAEWVTIAKATAQK